MRQTLIPALMLFLGLSIYPWNLAAQTKAVSVVEVSQQVEGYIQKSRAWNSTEK